MMFFFFLFFFASLLFGCFIFLFFRQNYIIWMLGLEFLYLSLLQLLLITSFIFCDFVFFEVYFLFFLVFIACETAIGLSMIIRVYKYSSLVLVDNLFLLK